jgi:hypothetical protein
MLAAGLDVCWVPVLFFAGSRSLAVYRLVRAPEFAAGGPIERYAAAWWEEFVVRQRPVRPVGLDLPFLKAKFPHGDGTTLDLPSSLATLDTQYCASVRDVAAQRKTLRMAEAALKDQEALLREHIGPASFASISGTGATYSLLSTRGGGRVLRRKPSP